MQNTKNDLLGHVVSRFRSIGEFAKAIGWSYSKAYRIVNYTQKADAEDMREMISVLQISDPAEIVSLFILPVCPRNV